MLKHDEKYTCECGTCIVHRPDTVGWRNIECKQAATQKQNKTAATTKTSPNEWKWNKTFGTTEERDTKQKKNSWKKENITSRKRWRNIAPFIIVKRRAMRVRFFCGAGSFRLGMNAEGCKNDFELLCTCFRGGVMGIWMNGDGASRVRLIARVFAVLREIERPWRTRIVCRIKDVFV